ncbi:Clan CA, family C19 [Tritrichomonas foetus]|uniref:Clan CA, family C19 n=1 Tax=Tritrichomonas foetus TaxID=1144522 RepID=A0A1J4JM42_9EUKA|nr:Clan CA, family C19 [Tritrichomonas foetus]|eukprot:OHS98597.1 Clan CA, family C19 [Tritrichomonas foetus]
MTVTLTGVINVCKQNLRTVPTNYLALLLNETIDSTLRITKIDEDFIFKWLEVYSIMIQSDIFEKQLSGLKYLSQLMSNDRIKPIVLEWFRNPENQEIISGNDIHAEFLSHYNYILSELAGADLLTDTFMLNMWNLHTVQHSTQLFQFFLIFNSIAGKLNNEYIVPFTSMCLKPQMISDSWVKFISQLGETLGRRGDSKEAFCMVKDVLLNLSFNENPHSFVAQDGLSRIVQFYLDPEGLTEFAKKMKESCGNSILFYRMLQYACSVPFESREFSNELLHDAIEFASAHPEDNNDIIYSLILNICMTNKQQIPDQFLDDLFSISDYDKQFYKFAIKLINCEFVSFDFVERFIMEKDSNMFSKQFIKFVREYIKKVNNFSVNLCYLPINKEPLLWKLATTQSKYSHLFAEFLCQLYASNDGFIISDNTIITKFLEHWVSYYNNTTGNVDMILNLLRYFIDAIEKPIDVSLYGVRRHNPTLEIPTITVKVSYVSFPAPQTHVVPESMLINALKHRISRTAMIPMHKFRLTMNQNFLNENETIGNIAGNNKNITVSLKMLDSNKFLPYCHERTFVPSLAIISRSDITDSLLYLLKERNNEAKKLLDYLPTFLSTLMKIDEIVKKENFDYSELLPLDYPSLFTYNLEAIRSKLDNSNSNDIKENFERTGGFEYLVNNITDELLNSIVPFLDKEMNEDLKKQYAPKLFSAIYPSLVVDSPKKISFVSNVQFLRKIANLREIELPEQYYDSIKILLFSTTKFVTKHGKHLLAQIKIPIEVFLELLTQDNQEIILDACIPHIDTYQHLFYDNFMENPRSFGLISAIEKMLTTNLLSDEQKENILQAIINEYLVVDSRPRDKHCFTTAVHCLSHLECKFLHNHMNELHANRSSYKEWKIDGDSTAVSLTGFSGLVNLGATCFLNSTLQQFFMIPPLRKSIIEYNGDDVFMIQLRNLFAKMLLSKGHPVSTEDLVKEWTGWDGEKMNPRVQQDACEFVQILIDKLENGIGKEFIQSLFGGTTVDNIEGISEEYHATRDQSFYTFTLPIKDIHNTTEALIALQSPDFLTGANQYHADTLDKKIDAKKYQMIGKLPPYFIVQLSRFTYDYATWERSKIDTPFEFPVNLDLSEYTCIKDQEARFNLHGVIMHSGTALYGHYVSYVKDRESGKWLYCNDSHVSEISEDNVLTNAYGKNQYKNGYLLFYDRDDISNESVDIQISNDLIEKIKKEIELIDEYSLFCSSSYFELCKSFSKSENINFVMIAIQYFFDTFPFTTHVENANDFAPQIIEKLYVNAELRQMLADYLSTGNFKCSLVYCPTDKIRKYALKMLNSLEPNHFNASFLESLIMIINDILPFNNCFTEYFELIDNLLDKSEEIRSYAIENNWVLRLSSFITRDIPSYLTNNQIFKPTYFYSCINISGLYRAISKLSPPNDLLDFILDVEFFKLLLITPHHPVENFAIVQLFQSFNDSLGRIKEFIIHFATHCGIYVDNYKLLQLLYIILGEESFDVISKTRLKTKDDFDFAASLAGEAFISQNFHQILLNCMDKWLLKYLMNDNDECRLDTYYTIAFLAPSEIFNDLLTFPTTGAIPLYGAITYNSSLSQFNFEGKEQSIAENAKIILDYLIQNAESAAERISTATSVVGLHYIEIIIRLGKIINFDVSQFLYNFSKMFQPKGSFDQHRKEILKYLSNNAPDILDFEYIFNSMNLSPDTDFNNIYTKMLLYIESFEKITNKLQPTPEFAFLFARYGAFTNFPHTAFKYSVIASFICWLAPLFPQIFSSYITTNFNSVVTMNYSSVLIVLEQLNLKLPILPYLVQASSVRQYFSLDELIIRSFKYNLGEIADQDVIPIISLLNSPQVGEEARKLIWELVYHKMPPYSIFRRAFEWCGDKVELTKYLMKIQPENEFNKDRFSKCLYQNNSTNCEETTSETAEGSTENQTETENENVNQNTEEESENPNTNDETYISVNHINAIGNVCGEQVDVDVFVEEEEEEEEGKDENDDTNEEKLNEKVNLDEIRKRIIEDLIECVCSSSESFSLAFDYLLANSREEFLCIGVCHCILRLDFSEKVDKCVNYLKLVFEGKEIEEQQQIFVPFISSILRHIRFLTNVLPDVREGGVNENDLKPLFGPISIISSFEDVIKSILPDDMKILKELCDSDTVRQKIKIPELQTLCELLAKCIFD